MRTHTRPSIVGRLRGLILALALLLVPLLGLAATPARAAGFTVTTLADSGEGSLRAAIDQANTTSGADTITFTLSGTIVLASTLPDINDDLTIDGSGQTITISGNNAVQVMVVNRSKTLNLNVLTIADGRCGTCSGGGISTVSGTINVNHSTFSGNSAGVHGGGIYDFSGSVTVSNSIFINNDATRGGGGGIFNDQGSLTVSNSSFSGNSARSGGGILNNEGSAAVSNSTFSGNSTTINGGGIYSKDGPMTVSNSTISGNRSGGIYSDAFVTLRNTIVANNTSSGSTGNCTSHISADSHNLASDGTCGGATQKSSAELNLGPLADNGGPTQTIALLPGSAAIDAGDDAVCVAAPVNNLDQRGIARPQGAACDVGAFEVEVVDQTPPQINLSVDGTLGSNGWYVSDVSVSWNVSDAESTITSQNGCDPQSVSSDTAGTTFTCSATSVGGTASQGVTIQRDATAPSVTATPDRIPQSNDWYNAPVTFRFSGNDGSGSGVTSCEADTTYRGPDSASASVTGNCTDAAGNVGSASASFLYDATTPSVSYSGNAGTYTVDQTINITCQASDNLSGIASSTCANISGPAYAFALGTTTRSASATDNAGNTGSGSTTFTVGVSFDILSRLTSSF
jgi:predicted outer membrane repeat protein